MIHKLKLTVDIFLRFVTGLFAGTLIFSVPDFPHRSSYPHVQNVEEFILAQYTMGSIHLWYVNCLAVIELKCFSIKKFP